MEDESTATAVPTNAVAQVELLPVSDTHQQPRSNEQTLPVTTSYAYEQENIPDNESKEKVEEDESNSITSHEFPESFHYATIHYLTGFVGMKAYIFVLLSIGLIFFQIVALLGFQIRQQISYCSSDADCSTSGQYCELSVGLFPIGTCQSIHNFKKCFADLDCGTNFYCSTGTQKSCKVKSSILQTSCNATAFCPLGTVCFNGFCNTPSNLTTYNYANIPCNSNDDCGLSGSTSFLCDNGYCVQDLTNCYGNNASCSSSSFCMANGYSSSHMCSDFLDEQCDYDDMCRNNNTGSAPFSSPYYCPYNRSSMLQGTCYYAGPSYCSTDSDCKLPQWTCKLRQGISWSIGHCEESEDSKTKNFCKKSEVFQVDLGALIFVAFVIAINVAKDLREAVISEMYFMRRIENNPVLKGITFGRLFGCTPGHVPAYDIWTSFLSMAILYLILFIRK
jgi:hypothetical protein